MNRHQVYPRSYEEASGLLFKAQRQRLMIHDDLTLAFVYAAVVVIFRERAIIHWPSHDQHVVVTASGPQERAEPIVIEHIEKFLPRGWHVHLNRAGGMLVHTPWGDTFLGNTHRIIYDPEFFDLYG